MQSRLGSGLDRDRAWWLLRLGNISTITREWTALQHAPLVPFLDILLSGGCSVL
jgi:hypothetical protein